MTIYSGAISRRESPQRLLWSIYGISFRAGIALVGLLCKMWSEPARSTIELHPCAIALFTSNVTMLLFRYIRYLSTVVFAPLWCPKTMLRTLYMYVHCMTAGCYRSVWFTAGHHAYRPVFVPTRRPKKGGTCYVLKLGGLKYLQRWRLGTGRTRLR